METEVRYCTTEDGAHIAFCVTGAGAPVIMTPSFQSIGDELPDMHMRLLESLSRGLAVVQYDGRGMGLSDRERADYSLEARIADLKAVAGALAWSGSVCSGACTAYQPRSRSPRVAPTA